MSTGQVHAGNILVESNVCRCVYALSDVYLMYAFYKCRITDVENSIIGLPLYYHHYLYLYELRKIQVSARYNR